MRALGFGKVLVEISHELGAQHSRTNKMLEFLISLRLFLSDGETWDADQFLGKLGSLKQSLSSTIRCLRQS